MTDPNPAATSTPSPIDRLIAAVRESPKYRAVSVDLVRAIGQRELAARRNLKEAIKATKNTLHQVAGAYLDGRAHYETWLETLAAHAGDPQRFRQDCVEIMGCHASTRERLPILDEFYTVTLGKIAPVRSVLDIACGFHPLAIPWMPLAPEATYIACDIYSDLMAFLERFSALAGVRGQAEVRDVATSPPPQQAELALLLKALPPLEQLDKTAGLNLLRTIRADYLLVSFPTRSLGGRNRSMEENYEARFRDQIRSESWEVERFVFPTELCFLIKK